MPELKIGRIPAIGNLNIAFQGRNVHQEEMASSDNKQPFFIELAGQIGYKSIK
jgi:hypothetical protein